MHVVKIYNTFIFENIFRPAPVPCIQGAVKTFGCEIVVVRVVFQIQIFILDQLVALFCIDSTVYLFMLMISGRVVCSLI